MPENFDHQSLIKWFKREKRDLPWRIDPTPYAVWVSEVMLQQTQVSVVIPYFERWMLRFPTVHKLAEASIEDVIKMWEGLGYYSRARNLHEGARFVVEHYNGLLPDDPVSLSKIKGIGEYTVGAILSFAFHQRYPAVDGNVMRVLARYFMVEDDISKTKAQKKIRGLAAEILPEEEPWIVAEALIELGATLCQRKPLCKECPLRNTCRSYINGAVERLPFKSARTTTENLFRAVAVLESKGKFLVRCVQKGEIMSGLHEFPYFETTKNGMAQDELRRLVKLRFDLQCHLHKPLPEVAHSFTKYNVRLFPFHLSCEAHPALEGFLWMTLPELDQVAFPSGHRTIFQKLKQLSKR